MSDRAGAHVVTRVRPNDPERVHRSIHAAANRATFQVLGRGVRRVLADLRAAPICYWKVPGNAGDSIIHLATVHAFEHAGCRWDRVDVTDDVAGRTVVIGGGGNLTPLYDHTARAITTFRDAGASRIVLLPHGVRGPQPVLEGCSSRDLLLCRDPVAARHARASAPHAGVRLEHDMAVHLRVAEVLSDGRRLTTAREFADARLAEHGTSLREVGARDVVRFMRVDAERRDGSPETDVDISHFLMVGETDDDVVLEATSLLVCVAAARSIVTDRLHVAFAAALLGVPCELHPNSYDKNASVYAHTLTHARGAEAPVMTAVSKRVDTTPSRTLRTLGRRSRRPSVSIVVNTLDRADDLRRTLVSLEALQYPNFEVVVVNGPSRDDTERVVRTYDGRIRTARCEVARLGVSRNIGLEQAAGEVVVFLDDDARPFPDWLDHLVLGFDRSDVAAVGGPVFDVPLGRIDWRVCTSTRLGVPNTDSPGPIELYQGSFADPFMYLAGCNMAFRRSALASIGGFNELLAYGYDDVEVCRLLIDAGWRIGYCERALVVHDRAPSAIRDGERRLKDPSSFVEARCIVVLQACTPNSDVPAVQERLRDWARSMRMAVIDEGVAGLRTDDEARSVAASIDRAVERGIELGTGSRPFRTIATQPAGSFLSFDPRFVLDGTRGLRRQPAVGTAVAYQRRRAASDT